MASCAHFIIAATFPQDSTHDFSLIDVLYDDVCVCARVHACVRVCTVYLPHLSQFLFPWQQLTDRCDKTPPVLWSRIHLLSHVAPGICHRNFWLGLTSRCVSKNKPR